MELEICGLGNALMDVLVRLDSDETLKTLGVAKGIMHLKDEAGWQEVFQQIQHLPHETHSGGSCANVIGTAAMLGARTAFCGQVGKDHFGKLYAQTMSDNHVLSRLHLLENGHTGKCLSLISPDTERTMLTSLGCAIELAPEHLFTHEIQRTRMLHVTGYLFTGGRMSETARMALEIARAHQVLISFDVSDPWVIETQRPLIWEIIEKYADVVFTNAAEAQVLTGKTPEEALHELASHCKIAVVKLGSRGSLVRSGSETHGIDVYRVKAVDTTGAGDAYAGGFLYGLAKGMELERCGRLASRVAAETVAQTGAVVTEPGKLRHLVEGI
ncbi:MAG: adenosine kinase [Myxococcota bacterium]